MKTILTICALAICGAFTIQAAEKGEGKGKGKEGEGAKRNPEEIFKMLDKDGDGFISKEEYLASPRAAKNKDEAEKRFTSTDKNNDGKLSKEEFMAAGKAKAAPKDGDAGKPKGGEGDKPKAGS